MTWLSTPAPIRLASRSVLTSTSGRRRARPRTYASISIESLPNPVRGDTRGDISSVNFAGSRGDAP